MFEGMFQPIHLAVEIALLGGFWMLFKPLKKLWRKLIR